jgi:GT2 family glycosyltransferase
VSISRQHVLGSRKDTCYVSGMASSNSFPLRHSREGGTTPRERLPLVVSVVLNWNNLPDTLESVASLQRSDYSNLVVWVVDNDSDNDPTPDLLARHPGIRVIRNTRNLGYGGGNNAGLRVAMAEGAAYVLLLNNDAIVAPDTVSRLVRAVEQDGRIGMATPTVFYYDRPNEIYWDGGSVDWETGWVSHDAKGLSVEGELRRSEWLDGCSLFVRVSALLDIGLLDERYFLYFEDAEWSVRAARRGWLNGVVVQAHAWHKISRSTGGRGVPAVRFYYARNRYLFLRSHGARKSRLKCNVRYAQDMLQEYWSLRREPESRKAIVTACVSLVRGHWGPYDSLTTVDWQVCRVADMLLLLLMNWTRAVKHCVLAAYKVARLLLGTPTGMTRKDE